MIQNENEKISKKLNVWNWIETILFGVAFANTVYWGFIGSFYSKNIILYSILLLVLIIAVIEYAYSSGTKEKWQNQIRFGIGAIFALILSFFSYLGIMSLYLPKFKEEVYSNLISRMENIGNYILIDYYDELMKNVNYLVPSDYYIENVNLMFNANYAFIMVIALSITLFSWWFVIKYIDNHKELIAIFVDNQQKKYKIFNKYKEQEYEEKKKNETIMNILIDFTNKLKKKGDKQ